MSNIFFVKGRLLTGQTESWEMVENKILAIDSESGLYVAIYDEANPPPELTSGVRKIDYEFGHTCVLLAAPTDIHVHAREDVSGNHTYKEDFVSAGQAALFGGIHGFADMPNNPIAPKNSSTYLQKLALTEKSLVPIVPYAAVLPDSAVFPFAVPYKVYLGPSIGEMNFPNRAELEKKLEDLHQQRVSFHCEDADVLEENKKQKTHFARRPIQAEILSTKFALEMIEKYQLKGKLCHFSAGSGLDLVREAKKRGLSVKVEVTPQHLFFSQEKIEQNHFPFPKTYFQMNPPIRSEGERELLLSAVKNDELDYLATDHAPHSLKEKEEGTSGLTGLDTLAPFLTYLLNEEKVKPAIVAKMCAERPGKFLNQFFTSLSPYAPWFKGLGQGLGFFHPGFSASFTVLDLKTPVKITSEILKTKSAWSPFIGHTFSGSVKCVFHRGKKISPL